MLGKLFVSVFHLVIISFIAFITFKVFPISSELDAYLRFERQRCKVNQKGVVRTANPDAPYGAQVTFSGIADGKPFTSHRLSSGDLAAHELSYVSAEVTLRSIEVGAETDCFVDPQDPNRSVLLLTHQSYSGFLLIPLVILAVAIANLVLLWRPIPKLQISPTAPKGKFGEVPRLQSPIGDILMTAIAGALFFGPMIFLGAFGFLEIYVRPARAYSDAKTWVESTCTVLESGIVRSSSHGSSVQMNTTYAADIFYRYSFNGVEYRASRFSFYPSSMTGQLADAQNIVERFPPQKSVTCFVDPQDPNRAVLDRSPTSFSIFALIPLVFALFGMLGSGAMIRRCIALLR